MPPSGAAARRSSGATALAEVGGVATDTVVEDAHTSMRLHAAGWRTVFHPEVMALGIAPEEIGAFAVQRGRWAKGSLQMLAPGPAPAQARPVVGPARRVHGELHPLPRGPAAPAGLPRSRRSSWSRALSPIDAAPLLYAALFVPQIVLVPLASRALTRGRYRLIDGERFAVARMTPYLRAMTALLGGRGGFQVTPKGGRTQRTGVARALWLPIALAAATVVALGYQTAAQMLFLPGMLSPGAHAVTVAAGPRPTSRSWPRWWRGPAARATSASAIASPWRCRPRTRPATGGRTRWATSRTSAARASRCGSRAPRRRRPAADRPAARRRADRGRGRGRPRRGRARPGELRLGVAFEHLEPAVADAIIEWCFRHPFGPDRPLRVAALEPARPRRAEPVAAAPEPQPSRA